MPRWTFESQPSANGEAAWHKPQRAVRAFEKAGFEIKRQAKHIIMSDGVRTIQIPRHNPVNAYTLARIIRDAGLSLAEFKELL